MTFATIYFPFNLFQGTAKPQNRLGEVETKVEFDHQRVKPNTQAFYGWHS